MRVLKVVSRSVKYCEAELIGFPKPLSSEREYGAIPNNSRPIDNAFIDGTPFNDEYRQKVYKRVAQIAKGVPASQVADVGCGTVHKLITNFSNARAKDYDFNPTGNYPRRTHPNRARKSPDFSLTLLQVKLSLPAARSATAREESRRRNRKIIRFPIAQRPSMLPVKLRERVLLLQGPVGPFFRRLQTFLEDNSFECWRVSFNAGDRFFAGKRGRIDFAGDAREWEAWLAALLEVADIDHIIIFGSARPAHRIARRLAEERGIPLLSLEEGYVRPGFVTVESGGNNADSPVAGALPPLDYTVDAEAGWVQKDYRSFRAMCLYGALYYGLRTLLSKPRECRLFHKKISALVEPFLWGRNCWRRLFGRARDFQTIERLLEHHDGHYFLVPLQVATDGQMGAAALGWGGVKLIAETLKSFARSAPADYRLVFKIHPLERGHSDHRRLIIQTAAALGITARVDVIDTGSLGLLTRHAAGMVTINSTSGLSAIFHGVPLLVVGDAFYAHEALATCARGHPDFDAFWVGGGGRPR